MPTVIRLVPTPDAAPVWPRTLVNIGTRHLYKETTVMLRRKRRCDVLLVCRRVLNNKMFLHEPCSSLLTLHKPSVITAGRANNTNPLLLRGLAEAPLLCLRSRPRVRTHLNRFIRFSTTRGHKRQTRLTQTAEHR